MRLRRETGDFSINMDVSPGAAEYKQQLPKGLSAEDFIGVLVNLSTTMTPMGSDTPITRNILGVILSVDTNDKNDDILVTVDERTTLIYSPVTGIIKTYKPGGGDDGSNPVA